MGPDRFVIAWSIGKLPQGKYALVFSGGKNSLAPTLFQAGSDPTIDSDADLLSLGSPFALAAGETRTDLDGGFVDASSIGDQVWADLDSDGVRDAGEPGLKNITVEIRWAGPDGVYDNGDDMFGNLSSDTTGIYGLKNMPAGTFRLKVKPPPGFLVSPTGPDNVAGPDGTVVFTLGFSENRTDLDFGLIPDTVVKAIGPTPTTTAAPTTTTTTRTYSPLTPPGSIPSRTTVPAGASPDDQATSTVPDTLAFTGGGMALALLGWLLLGAGSSLRVIGRRRQS